MQALTTFLMSSGWGWSHTLKTLSFLICLSKPAAVAWRLLRAYLMSPSAVKIKASSPSLSAMSFSWSMTYFSLYSTSESESFVNLTIAHLDWIGSISLLLSLQARAKRVVLLNSVITILSACCALVVSASASSRMIILCIPCGTVTF